MKEIIMIDYEKVIEEMAEWLYRNYDDFAIVRTWEKQAESVRNNYRHDARQLLADVKGLAVVDRNIRLWDTGYVKELKG
jgi:hypothetical protein